MSAFLTGCPWPAWNGLKGFTLQEMSRILMLWGFFKMKNTLKLSSDLDASLRSLISFHYSHMLLFSCPSLFPHSLCLFCCSAIGGLLKRSLWRVWKPRQLSPAWAQLLAGSSRMSGETVRRHQWEYIVSNRYVFLKHQMFKPFFILIPQMLFIWCIVHQSLAFEGCSPFAILI